MVENDDAVPGRRASAAHLVVLAVGAAFGTALLVASPPFKWGDENTHFRQAYRLSEGDLHPACPSEGHQVTTPLGIVRFIYFTSVLHRKHFRLAWGEILRMRSIEARRDERVAAPLERAPYTPLPYVAQAIGIAVAELATSSVLVLHYAARAGNFLSWLGLTWLALRITPGLGWSFGVVALAPMAVFVATVCSVDAFANALALLWTGLVLRVAAGPEERIGGEELCALAVLVVALTLAKFVYALLVPLALVIPPRRVGGRLRLFGIVGLLGALAGATLLGWVAFAGPDCLAGTAITRPESVAQQWRSLTEKPEYFLAVLGRAVTQARESMMQGLVVTKWPVYVPPVDGRLLLLALVLALACDERSPGGRSPARRAAALAVVVACFVATVLVAFVYWTEPGARSLAGFQMRYMLPLLPPLLVALEPPALPIPAWANRLGRGAAMALVAVLLARTLQRAFEIFIP